MNLKEEKLIEYGKLLTNLSFDNFYRHLSLYKQIVESKKMTEDEEYYYDFFSSLSAEQIIQYLYIQKKIARDVLKGYFDLLEENKDKYKIVYKGEELNQYVDLTNDLSKLKKMLFEENGLEKYSKHSDILKKIRKYSKDFKGK